MDFKQIQELIKIVSKSELAEVKISQDNFKITIKNKQDGAVTMVQNHSVAMPQSMMSMPQQAAAPATTAIAPVAKDSTSNEAASNGNLIEFKSPMIGTFYRKPGPDKEAFVKVGDTVKPGDVICVVEAMKLFNEIECDISGTIVKIIADDNSPVEYDQPLFLIEPK
ncbi:MAG: acetyl-CoA carboxylase biotin carboxyl carrier protein [Bacteroidota bacterium]